MDVEYPVKVNEGIRDDISPERHWKDGTLLTCEDFALDETWISCVVFLEFGREFPHLVHT